MGEENKDPFGNDKGYLTVKEFPDNVGPAAFPEYPRPWSLKWKGNGHLDVFAANNAYVAHVFCWDAAEITDLEKKLRIVNKNDEDVQYVPPYC